MSPACAAGPQRLLLLAAAALLLPRLPANGGNAAGGGCTDTALVAVCSHARRATVGHCLVCVQSHGPCSDVFADAFCTGGAAAGSADPPPKYPAYCADTCTGLSDYCFTSRPDFLSPSDLPGCCHAAAVRSTTRGGRVIIGAHGVIIGCNNNASHC